jgi:hypothetical protein
VTEPELLDLAGLAARWSVTEDEARRVVSKRGVPFIRVSAAIDRISWKYIRFSLHEIREWENTHQERLPAKPEESTPIPRKTRKIEEPEGPSLLGNWRRPSLTSQVLDEVQQRTPKRKSGAK